jgi:hypothetical protein
LRLYAHGLSTTFSRTGQWNYGPLVTTAFAKNKSSAFASLSMPDPDMVITGPGDQEKDSLQYLLSMAYDEGKVPDDAVYLLSNEAKMKLLAYKQIKEVVFLMKTTGKRLETIFLS